MPCKIAVRCLLPVVLAVTFAAGAVGVSGAPSSARGPAVVKNENEPVEILFLYTDKSEEYLGGDIETAVNQHIVTSNQIYRGSNVPITLRSIGAVKVDAKDYQEISNSTLYTLSNDKAIRKLRDDTGADFVALITMSYRGMMCGWGHLGTSKDGVIPQGVKDGSAYSVYGVDCRGGTQIFTHELGHNLGLSHGAKQGGKGGGHHPYGQGYGVQDKFATTMAYASVFNAKWVPFHSSPDLTCEGLSCGDANTGDAARSLRQMAAQYPTYRPSKNDGGGGGDAPDIENPVPPQGTNVVLNPSFEGSLQSWSTLNDATIKLSDVRRRFGKNSVEVSARTTTGAGIAQSVSGKLQSGKAYTFSAWVRLKDVRSDVVHIGFDDGQKFYPMTPAAGSGVTDQWTEIKGEFTYGVSGGAVNLAVFGPATNVVMYVDQISIAPKVVDEPPPENLVSNGDFESGNLLSWSAAYNARLSVAQNGYNSQRSMLIGERSGWYHGAKQELARLESGVSYDVSAWFRMDGKPDVADLWLLVEDEAGPRWQRIGGVNASANTWVRASGQFKVSFTGALKRAELRLQGPKQVAQFQVDNVSIVKSKP